MICVRKNIHEYNSEIIMDQQTVEPAVISIIDCCCQCYFYQIIMSLKPKLDYSSINFSFMFCILVLQTQWIQSNTSQKIKLYLTAARWSGHH